MKSCLNAFSTLLAVLCAFLFVFLAFFTLTIFIADRLLFSAGTYKQALRGQHVYDRMPELIAEQVIYQDQHTSSGEGLAPELKRLTQSDWEIMLSEIITPAALQTQTESVIDQLLVYINTPGQALELKVSLVDFKQKLDGEEGLRATMQIINAQPACSSEEWAQIVSGAQSAQFQDLPYCRPSAEILAASEPYLRDALHQLVASIPDETYMDNTPASASRATRTQDSRADLKRVRRYIWLSLCIPAGLILLVAAFGVRSLTGCGLWLGIPLLFTGLLTFLTALATWMLPGWLIARNAPSDKVSLEGVAPGVTQMLVDVGTSIAHSAARTLGILAILLILLGLGLIAAGILFGLATRSTRKDYPYYPPA
jgi:hypothetical protein